MKIVPNNFGYVNEFIFRCAEPEERHFPFLESLSLRLIIYLSHGQTPMNPALLSWAHDSKVEVIQKSVVEGSRVSVSEDVVLDVLKILLDREHYPVLVTCSTGRYRTGTVIACLRKVQTWNLFSILEEYRRFACSWGQKGGVTGRVEDEQFIELFDIDLVNATGGNAT
eukprot:PhF_6_TR19775/c0_g1_i1/m.28843